jgi:rhamnose transport system substrate-binding protein
MSRRRLGIGGLVISVALLAALVAALTATAGQNAATHKGQNYKIFLVPKLIGVNVFTENGKGAKEAAKELGDTVIYNGPTEAVAAKQVPFINTAARQGADAIIISANDPNAVAPALKRAAARGAKIVSYDGDVARDARTIFVSPPSAQQIGAFQVEWIGSQIGYSGEIAILSATPTAANQNTWIKFMKAELKKPKYRNMKLVKVAYGNDNPTDSAKETQALLQGYPNLKGIISPTTVGVAAAAQVLQQEGKCKTVGRSSVELTGLGLPNEMRKYIKAGCAKKVGLWNERDFGYLAAYVAHYVLDGTLTGKIGQTFTAGRLGKRTVVVSDGNRPVVVLGDPLVFTKANVDKFNF